MLYPAFHHSLFNDVLQPLLMVPACLFLHFCLLLLLVLFNCLRLNAENKCVIKKHDTALHIICCIVVACVGAEHLSINTHNTILNGLNTFCASLLKVWTGMTEVGQNCRHFQSRNIAVQAKCMWTYFKFTLQMTGETDKKLPKYK